MAFNEGDLAQQLAACIRNAVPALDPTSAGSANAARLPHQVVARALTVVNGLAPALPKLFTFVKDAPTVWSVICLCCTAAHEAGLRCFVSERQVNGPPGHAVFVTKEARSDRTPEGNLAKQVFATIGTEVRQTVSTCTHADVERADKRNILHCVWY